MHTRKLIGCEFISIFRDSCAMPRVTTKSYFPVTIQRCRDRFIVHSMASPSPSPSSHHTPTLPPWPCPAAGRRVRGGVRSTPSSPALPCTPSPPTASATGSPPGPARTCQWCQGLCGSGGRKGLGTGSPLESSHLNQRGERRRERRW